MNFIDRFLNGITMYRLAFYGLLVMAVYAVVLGFSGVLPYSGLQLLISLAVLLFVCGTVNWFFSALTRAPINTESFLITGLILFFIMLPAGTLHDGLMLALVSTLAMASKYLLVYRRKHIFNPVAAALVILGLAGIGNAYWWAATLSMIPVTLILGLLVVRKLRRFNLLLVFLAVSVVVIGLQNATLDGLFTSWPLLFFGTIMLTEPQTMPPTRRLQLLYAGIVGVLFSVQFHVGPLYSSPEAALVLGNVFSFFVSSRQKLRLQLISREQIAANLYEFTFSSPEKLRFTAGQYIEWTLPRWGGDTRGNRRYFTIASSPDAPEVRIGVRISKDGSSFKNMLMRMQTGDILMAAGVAGEFTLPVDAKIPLVFIAGGIGITPFVSMIRYLLATKQHRDIVLFYAYATEAEYSFQPLLEDARREMHLKLVPVVTQKSGFITPDMVAREVPDWRGRMFYLSGPDAMVRNYEQLLRKLGLPRRSIKKDYFPGF